MNLSILEKAQKSGLIHPDTIERLKNRQCPLCSNSINFEEFKDELALKEFTISGICQKCQNKIFK